MRKRGVANIQKSLETGKALVGGLHRLILQPDLISRALWGLSIRKSFVDVLANPRDLPDGVADIVRSRGIQELP